MFYLTQGLLFSKTLNSSKLQVIILKSVSTTHDLVPGKIKLDLDARGRGRNF